MDSFMEIIDMLKSDENIIINKNLAHEIGRDQAIVYCELLSKFKYCTDNNKLMTLKDGKKYFYCTIDELEIATTMNNYEQRRSIKKLVELGLIIHKNAKPKGFESQRRFFWINNDINLLIKYINLEPEN